jgi:multiple sugar transport system permease protein
LVSSGLWGGGPLRAWSRWPCPAAGGGALAASRLGLVTLLGSGPVVAAGRALSPRHCPVALGLATRCRLARCCAGTPWRLTRHEFEEAAIRFLTGLRLHLLHRDRLIPFYVMVMTSLKNQAELMQTRSISRSTWSKGWELFRSYELFRDFNFGQYLWTSFYVSVLTVLITLLFSIPGAYAVARLRLPDRRRSRARSC